MSFSISSTTNKSDEDGTSKLINTISSSIFKISLNIKEIQAISLNGNNADSKKLFDQTKVLISNLKAGELKSFFEINNVCFETDQ